MNGEHFVMSNEHVAQSATRSTLQHGSFAHLRWLAPDLNRDGWKHLVMSNGAIKFWAKSKSALQHRSLATKIGLYKADTKMAAENVKWSRNNFQECQLRETKGSALPTLGQLRSE
jgi:hypothetical protein